MMKLITEEEVISMTSKKSTSLKCNFLKEITSVFFYMVSKSRNVLTMSISFSDILKSDSALNPFSSFKGQNLRWSHLRQLNFELFILQEWRFCTKHLLEKVTCEWWGTKVNKYTAIHCLNVFLTTLVKIRHIFWIYLFLNNFLSTENKVYWKA